MLIEINGKSLEVDDFDVEKFEMLLVNLEMLGYESNILWFTIDQFGFDSLFLWEIKMNGLNFMSISFNCLKKEEEEEYLIITTGINYSLYNSVNNIINEEHQISGEEFSKVIEVIYEKTGMV